MGTSQHVPAAVRAAERAAQCRRRVVELQSRRPVRPEHVARAQEALRAAQTRATSAQARLVQVRARTGSTSLARSGSLENLRQRVQAVGLYDVYVAAFGIGGSTSLFDFEAFVHGLTGLPDLEARIVDQAVWELERF